MGEWEEKCREADERAEALRQQRAERVRARLEAETPLERLARLAKARGVAAKRRAKVKMVGDEGRARRRRERLRREAAREEQKARARENRLKRLANETPDEREARLAKGRARYWAKKAERDGS